MNSIADCAKFILRGDLVAIPTETVYGLGGNAYDSESIAKIYKIKNRPRSNPLICHVYSFEFAENNVFELSSRTRIVYRTLADEFWPGPLAIIGKKKPKIVDEVTLSGKVGVRCPNNNLTLSLLKLLQVPIAAPSANRSSHISPTSPRHVMKEFSDIYTSRVGIKVWILDDGECCNVGVESTVLEYDEEKNKIVIFRCGGISREQIRRLLFEKLQRKYEWVNEIEVSYFENNFMNSVSINTPENSILPSPGMDIRHYSPIVNTQIIRFITNVVSYEKVEVDLNNTVIIDIGSKMSFIKDMVGLYFSLCDDENYIIACRKLFGILHQAEDVVITNFKDPAKVNIYITEFRMNDDISMALWDRLYRASSGKFIYLRLDPFDFCENPKFTFYQPQSHYNS